MDKQQRINNQMSKARKARLAQIAIRSKETYLNRKWLFKKSCIERLTIEQIAKLCKVTYEEIWDAHKKLKIPKNMSWL